LGAWGSRGAAAARVEVAGADYCAKAKLWTWASSRTLAVSRDAPSTRAVRDGVARDGAPAPRDGAPTFVFVDEDEAAAAAAAAASSSSSVPRPTPERGDDGGAAGGDDAAVAAPGALTMGSAPPLLDPEASSTRARELARAADWAGLRATGLLDEASDEGGMR